MNREELNKTLKLHKKWLNNEKGGLRAVLLSADLRGADLRGADLRYADLRGADLQRADLQYADLQDVDLQDVDLRGANINFSCLPLWCGGLNFKIDERLAKQLMYHVINLMQYSNIEIPKSDNSLYKWLSDSHLITEYNLPVLEDLK